MKEMSEGQIVVVCVTLLAVIFGILIASIYFHSEHVAVLQNTAQKECVEAGASYVVTGSEVMCLRLK